MSEPSDEEIMKAVDKMLEVAQEKAIDEASDEWIDGLGHGHIEPASDEEKTRIDKEMEELRKRFETVLTPKPADFDVMIDTMQKVEDDLGVFAATDNLPTNSDKIGGNADFGLIDTAKGDIDSDWDGKFKNELIENYLTPLSPGIIATQGNLARYLREHAVLMKLVYERRRRDAKKIAEEAVPAFEAINDSKGSDLKILLSVFSALIGFGAAVAGPFASQATSLAIGLSSASFAAANGIGGNFHPTPGEDSPLGADTVEGVRDNIYKALGDNDKTMQDEEDEILTSLQHVEGVVYPMVSSANIEKGSDLVPLRPEINDVMSPEDLRDGFTSYPDDGDSGGEGDGGSGSWFGPGAPDDWDGSVHNPLVSAKVS